MTNYTDVKTIQAAVGHELMHAIYGAINGHGEASGKSMAQAVGFMVTLIKQVIEDEESIAEILEPSAPITDSPITPPEEQYKGWLEPIAATPRDWSQVVADQTHVAIAGMAVLLANKIVADRQALAFAIDGDNEGLVQVITAFLECESDEDCPHDYVGEALHRREECAALIDKLGEAEKQRAILADMLAVAEARINKLVAEKEV